MDIFFKTNIVNHNESFINKLKSPKFMVYYFFIFIVFYIISPFNLFQSSSINDNYFNSYTKPVRKTISVKTKVCAISTNDYNSKELELTNKTTTEFKMSIVIDDFGSYDQSGVDKLLNCNVPLTCAVIPFTDNTENNIKKLASTHHEIILHLPMQSHVNLPENWYGTIYISTTDTREIINQKIDKCLNQFPKIKGFNIHIGSGVSKNKEQMKYIYEYANNHNLYFLDSRTIITNGTIDAAAETNSIYLGRDVFLEADKNRSYSGVCNRLIEGATIAKEKGYSIVIGHVGAEGGENTANAICDMVSKIQDMGVKIVPLSEIYNDLQNN